MRRNLRRAQFDFSRTNGLFVCANHGRGDERDVKPRQRKYTERHGTLYRA